MMEPRIAYVLDPHMAVLRSVEMEWGEEMEAVKAQIGSEAIDTVRFDTDHLLFFDDDGLREGITHYTMLTGHPDPLVGKLVLLPCDPDAGMPQITLQEALARFQCYRAVMDPIIETVSSVTDENVTFISAVTGFGHRVEVIAILVEPISH